MCGTVRPTGLYLLMLLTHLKQVLDKCWQNEDITYSFGAWLQGNGSCSEMTNEKS